jgi:hypothetical protein
MKRPIIGLCGYARAGKDTLAKAIIGERTGWYFSRFAFADELKDDVSKAMRKALNAAGQPVDMIYVAGIMSNKKEQIRPMLVGWGAGMRAIDPGHWIKRLEQMMRLTLARPIDPPSACASGRYNPGFQRMTCRSVITDVRYLNEADWVRSLGGLVVWIERPGVFAANDEELFKTLPDYCDVRLLLDGSIEENQVKFCKIAEDWLDQCRQGEENAETH